MVDREPQVVFPRTYGALKRRIGVLDSKRLERGQSGAFGMTDGDSMDDDEMLRARTEISENWGQRAGIVTHLARSRPWTRGDLDGKNFDRVELGARVVAHVQFPGETKPERESFSVGNPLDVEVEAYVHPDDSPYRHRIRSVSTPFVSAISGARAGDVRTYAVDDGQVKVWVKRVTRSPFVLPCE